jgi:hypothetical protein
MAALFVPFSSAALTFGLIQTTNYKVTSELVAALNVETTRLNEILTKRSQEPIVAAEALPVSLTNARIHANLRKNG